MSTIPKIINYCWFGKNKKNEEIIKCINSWKKFMPSYEIKEWNEDNFDVNCNLYVKEAYETGNYAFVSDFARLKIIYDNGGIYFDTDVEVLKDISELIRENGFIGFENTDTITTGLGFAANKGNKLIKLFMDDYINSKFILSDGNYDKTPCPYRITKILTENGIKLNNQKQKIFDIIIYPKEFFCPIDYYKNEINITKNTFTIHHYHSSWFTKEERFIEKMRVFINRHTKEKYSKNFFKIFIITYQIFMHPIKTIKKINKKRGNIC